MAIGSLVTLLNLLFVVVLGLYFTTLLRQQQGSRAVVERESRKELERLQKMRALRLGEPLAERIRPRSFADIVGQEEGIKALRAALCGPNPQHVIIYGPPGVGKTAAARLVLEEARRSPHSPFGPDARFVEIDATTARFDERGIADPLIGSVHDPIYQGAGPLGIAGIPQPKPGAVTRAHGGVLFLDEIGELHPVQMHKLLKVLEDRKVLLESAYYTPGDPNVPAHIRDIFENGLPADFRLVGATTRLPQEIPPAIRSRCVEVFFRALYPAEIGLIARRAAEKIGLELEPEALEIIQRHATSGRDAANIVQMAAGIAMNRGLSRIPAAEVEWVVQACQFAPRADRQVPQRPLVGVAMGLAVTGPGVGTVVEVEVAATRAAPGAGRLTVTGIVDQEQLEAPGRVLRRQGMARAAAENARTALRLVLPVDPRDYDLHVNFPGGVPVDGPSAGVTMAVAVASAILNRPARERLAMTGEVSVRGQIKPVGGVPAKLEAARHAGATRVLIPAGNWQEAYARLPGVEVVPVRSLGEVLDLALLPAGAEAEPEAVPERPAVAVGVPAAMW
ncbi:ATP-dependent protease LonB [Caldinitratiruptor microaerophilus]|uniref:endopeptidase La n=1 Tax=Caldinitratiruptor microaerophilus TaxID=671077 RepID=A0AA35CN95_9FIRM|nr:ATP-dependent protease LonB [Caldinitratiruptor microaerophilus]BDG61523.1 ATP-dependent protease LonB [Caldinitratiruptor microaerophilus]